MRGRARGIVSLKGSLVLTAALAAIFALTACGQQAGPSGGATGGQANPPGAGGAGAVTAPTTAPAPVEKAAPPMSNLTVQLRDDPKGKILVDGAGKTLYTFDRDEKGKSNCTGTCLQNWPALTVNGDPTKPSDLPGELETITRPEGGLQVVYNDMPLYYYSKDSALTDTTGDGVGGVWHVVISAKY